MWKFRQQTDAELKDLTIEAVEFFASEKSPLPGLLDRFHDLLAEQKDKKLSKSAFFSRKGIMFAISVIKIAVTHPLRINTLYKAYSKGFFADSSLQKTLLKMPAVTMFIRNYKNLLRKITNFLTGIEPKLAKEAVRTLTHPQKAEKVIDLLQATISQQPNWMQITQDALQLCTENPGLRDALALSSEKNGWLRNTITNALTKTQLKEYGITPPIWGLAPDLIRQSRSTAEVVNMLRTDKPLLVWVEAFVNQVDATPSLKAIIEAQPEALATLAVAITKNTPNIKQVADSLNFAPEILYALTPLLKDTTKAATLLQAINAIGDEKSDNYSTVIRILNAFFAIAISPESKESDLQKFLLSAPNVGAEYQHNYQLLIPYINTMITPLLEQLPPQTLDPIANALKNSNRQRLLNLLKEKTVLHYEKNKLASSSIIKFMHQYTTNKENLLADTLASIATRTKTNGEFTLLDEEFHLFFPMIQIENANNELSIAEKNQAARDLIKSLLTNEALQKESLEYSTPPATRVKMLAINLTRFLLSNINDFREIAVALKENNASNTLDALLALRRNKNFTDEFSKDIVAIREILSNYTKSTLGESKINDLLVYLTTGYLSGEKNTTQMTLESLLSVMADYFRKTAPRVVGAQRADRLLNDTEKANATLLGTKIAEALFTKEGIQNNAARANEKDIIVAHIVHVFCDIKEEDENASFMIDDAAMQTLVGSNVSGLTQFYSTVTKSTFAGFFGTGGIQLDKTKISIDNGNNILLDARGKLALASVKNAIQEELAPRPTPPQP